MGVLRRRRGAHARRGAGECLSEEAEAAPASTLCKLYVSHDGVSRLVASLSARDYPDWSGNDDPRLLARMTARVSPDGRWLAFMSQRPLTGYDNRDVKSGQPDEEVFLYDAQSGRLSCASCDPSGGRPAGVPYGETVEGLDGLSYKIWEEGQGLAGNLPVWTSYGGGPAQYQSRYLSDNGRLFFNSSDALSAQDVNGVGDVYQFEPAGVGDCASGSAGFQQGSGGCVGLISSGSSGEESGFLDASASGGRDGQGGEGGGDVFFFTAARLDPQEDVDSSLDVYDAHECSTQAPCFSEAASQPPPCATGDSCKPAPSPQPPLFGAPASATFSGVGNPPTTSPPVAVKAKKLTRAQLLARALRVCHRKTNRKRRASCQRQARRRYGSRASKTSASHRGKR